MKLCAVDHTGTVRIGLLADETIRLLDASFADVADIVQMTPAEIEAHLTRDTLPASGARFRSPIRRFSKNVLCTGWNYVEHFDESVGKRGAHEVDMPTAPTFFSKSPNVIAGPFDALPIDKRISKKWDYEAEIAVIIGKTGRSIPESRALDHVFGYCLANDLSQRDLQRRHGGQWLKGKSIDGTMPLGPYVVTKDSVDIENITLECRVNGDVRQQASSAQMAFPIARLIAELSFGMTLNAGDVLLTGTPSGIGMAREPATFLEDGDVIEITSNYLGRLENRMAATDLAGDSNVVID